MARVFKKNNGKYYYIISENLIVGPYPSKDRAKALGPKDALNLPTNSAVRDNGQRSRRGKGQT